jgi:hypothetical protein
MSSFTPGRSFRQTIMTWIIMNTLCQLIAVCPALNSLRLIAARFVLRHRSRPTVWDVRSSLSVLINSVWKGRLVIYLMTLFEMHMLCNVEWQDNYCFDSERMWQEAFVAYLRYCTIICLEWTEKNHENRQDSPSPVLDGKPGPPECE